MRTHKRIMAVVLLAVVLLVGATVGQAAMMTRRVILAPTPLAKNAGLQHATGFADIDVEKGTLKITVNLAAGTRLPLGSVLEGWVVDAGRKGGPGMSHASDKDQKYGVAFGNPDFAALSRDIPYALSTGLLRLRAGSTRTYVGSFKIANTLTPYNAVVVTLESDGNRGAYDPRPGTPVLAGEIPK
ncbi:MAG: hypothetical protein QN131_15130 [Armatimonadota bacterium]|nr:hypothetical protein [Armatimonadota bacterium]MDR7551246.1 hypothetical protein [Armatimonadota bacterium]